MGVISGNTFEIIDGPILNYAGKLGYRTVIRKVGSKGKMRGNYIGEQRAVSEIALILLKKSKGKPHPLTKIFQEKMPAPSQPVKRLISLA